MKSNQKLVKNWVYTCPSCLTPSFLSADDLTIFDDAACCCFMCSKKFELTVGNTRLIQANSIKTP